MKIRQGFVSNSSSSSFVCSVCGVSESGWDGQYDSTVWECWGGHEFHESCMSLTPKRKADELANDIEAAIVTLGLAPYEAEELRDVGDYDNQRDWILEFVTYDGLHKAICPVCTLDSIPDYVMLEYLSKKVGMSYDQIREEIRSKYKNLKGWAEK
jgi:hypothetical protein